MSKHTEEQLANYRSFEKVRKSNRFNMLEPQARQTAGLTRDEHIYVISNYDTLRHQAEPQETKK